MPKTALVPLDRLDPEQAWQPWQPDAKNPWNLKWAGHLYRRAAFGANLPEMRAAVKDGLPATLDRLLRGAPGADERDAFLAVAGKQIAKKDNIAELRGWWLYSMFHTQHPVREKMTLFWHNHFATSITKVQQVMLMYNQNQLLRKYALGSFRPMLLEISKDPAMLVWLDSNSNVKGRPNENYARELMELFSLGVGHYTEQDVRQAARAFTGWHTEDDAFDFVPGFHDNDPKTVLGQRGNWNGDDIVRIVLQQPTCAEFLVAKLYRFFVSETVHPPASFLKPLADSFRESDYDIAALVRRILGSQHFFSDYAYRKRIKSPVEYVLGAVRAAVPGVVQAGSEGNLPFAPAVLVPKVEQMGQPLFAPPNVKGWPGGRSWLNTATVLARHNFAQMVASGKWQGYVPGLQFEAVERAQAAAEAERLAAEEAAAAAQGKPGAPPKPPAAGSPIARPLPKAPEEPPPPKELDPAGIVHQEKANDPSRAVGVLIDLLLQGDITPAARAKLTAFVAEGKPKDRALDSRIRAAVHAIMAMPEYELA
jgi:uncharacterized protein (DUF1800 family)